MWNYGSYVGSDTFPTIEQAARLPLTAGIVAGFQHAHDRSPASWIELLDFMQQMTLELYGNIGLHDEQIKQRIKAFLPGRW